MALVSIILDNPLCLWLALIPRLRRLRGHYKYYTGRLLVYLLAYKALLRGYKLLFLKATLKLLLVLLFA